MTTALRWRFEHTRSGRHLPLVATYNKPPISGACCRADWGRCRAALDSGSGVADKVEPMRFGLCGLRGASLDLLWQHIVGDLAGVDPEITESLAGRGLAQTPAPAQVERHHATRQE